MTVSCSKDNEKIKLRIAQLESKIKKLKEERKLKSTKIQNLMDELSTCKESKVKYVEKKDDFDVIDGDEKLRDNKLDVQTENTVNKTDNTKVESKTNIDSKENLVVKEEFKFSSPEDIKGKCKKSDINRVFHNLKPYLKKCFKNNNIKRGKIGFNWKINENGSVEEIRIIKNNIYNKNLSACLKVVLKSGRYNSPDEASCEVNYIFKL